MGAYKVHYNLGRFSNETAIKKASLDLLAFIKEQVMGFEPTDNGLGSRCQSQGIYSFIFK